MTASPALLGTLDPTYNLLSGSEEVLLPATDLSIYLRLFHLFLGSPIVPRTFFIHGYSNPFFDLFSFGEHGKKEIRDFLSSGVARVSGHNHQSFQSFTAHYQTTLREQHPLIVDDSERLAFAQFLDECLPPQTSALFLWQDFKAVIDEFPAVFKDCLLELHADDAEFIHIDQAARARLAQRNLVNEVKYPEDRWGRNEICDLLRAGFFRGTQATDRAVQATVAAYQKTFAATVSSEQADAGVVLLSPPRISPEWSDADFAWQLTAEFARESIWEIGLEVLSTRPWREIDQLRSSLQWQRWLYDYDKAISERNRDYAFFAMEQLTSQLSKLYPPKRNMKTGWIQPIVVDPTSVVGPIAKLASTTIKGFLRFFSEPQGTSSPEETWFSLTPEFLDTAAAWYPSVRKAIKAQSKRARYEHLYNWRLKREQPE